MKFNIKLQKNYLFNISFRKSQNYAFKLNAINPIKIKNADITKTERYIGFVED